MAASHAIEVNDTEAASIFLKNALEREPDNPLILSQAFEFEMTEGNFRAALQFAKRLHAADAATAPMTAFMAIDAFLKKDWQATSEYLDHVKGLGLDSLVAPLLRGWMLTLQGDLEAGLAAMDTMQKVAAFNRFRIVHKAYMLDYTNRNELALEAYQEALKDSRIRSLQPLVANASLLVRINRIDEATELLQSYLLKLPQSYVLQAALKEVISGRAPAVVARNPRRAVAYSMLNAATQLARDRVSGPAILYARLSQYFDSRIEETNLLLGNLFLETGRTGTARASLANISGDSPLSEFARVREAHALRREDKSEQATEILRVFLEENPDNVLVRSTLADFLRESGRFEEALVEYTLAVNSSSGETESNWFLYFSRGVTNEQIGNWSAAETDMRRSLELNPGEPMVLNYLGYSLIDRGKNYEEARGLIEEAVKQSPNDGAIVDSMGWAQFLLGEYEDAVKNLERAVELEPTDPIINEHLGDAYWMVNRKLEARFQWRHALVLDPEESRIESIENRIALGLASVERAGNN
jgi:tetratricopeptide (TPR) repeat protein